MTYQETLCTLYDETAATTIFALLSYGDAKIGMGFRRECVGSDLKDPVIDGIHFMLCADAWNTILECVINRTDDLMCTPDDEIEIRLRAVSLCFPSAIINLGSFRVISMAVEENTSVMTLRGPIQVPLRIRLEIERYK